MQTELKSEKVKKFITKQLLNKINPCIKCDTGIFLDLQGIGKIVQNGKTEPCQDLPDTGYPNAKAVVLAPELALNK